MKYVILAQLLSHSKVDYLTQKEAKIFATDAEIKAMTTLKQGFEENDINTVQRVISDKRVNLLGDQLIAQYLGDLLRSVRLKALEEKCGPYKAVRLDFLAECLNVNQNEIRSLLAELILEEKIKG